MKLITSKADIFNLDDNTIIDKLKEYDRMFLYTTCDDEDAYERGEVGEVRYDLLHHEIQKALEFLEPYYNSSSIELYRTVRLFDYNSQLHTKLNKEHLGNCWTDKEHYQNFIDSGFYGNGTPDEYTYVITGQTSSDNIDWLRSLIQFLAYSAEDILGYSEYELCTIDDTKIKFLDIHKYEHGELVNLTQSDYNFVMGE